MVTNVWILIKCLLSTGANLDDRFNIGNLLFNSKFKLCSCIIKAFMQNGCQVRSTNKALHTPWCHLFLIYDG